MHVCLAIFNNIKSCVTQQIVKAISVSADTLYTSNHLYIIISEAFYRAFGELPFSMTYDYCNKLFNLIFVALMVDLHRKPKRNFA